MFKSGGLGWQLKWVVDGQEGVKMAKCNFLMTFLVQFFCSLWKFRVVNMCSPLVNLSSKTICCVQTQFAGSSNFPCL